MNLFALIAADIRAKAEWVYGSASRGHMLKALFTDGTLAMVVYRKMQWAQKWRLTPLAMLYNKINVVCSRCVIGRGAQFGPGFVLVHSIGVVINSSVRAGSRVIVEHLVTIGAEKGGAPVLGDNVFIGAGAKIVGAVRIGSNVRIGANAVVVEDVPDDCTAVGIPARVVGRKREGG